MQGWLNDSFPWSNHTLPRGYLKRSDINGESHATLHALSDACAFAREDFGGKLPRRWKTYRFTDGSFPGFVLDSPSLRDTLIEATRLGLLAVPTQTEGELPDADDLNVIRIVRWVSPILRGYIEHVQSVPLRSDNWVTLYLKISGLSDILARDHDGVGWHYHYCDRDGRRSDTMLSFDTNQPPRTDSKGRKVPLRDNAPLFWERHSEANKKFDARADQWGKKKRSSVFDAAQPELTKKKPYDFRRPADVAQPVWPLNAHLSLPAVTPTSSR